MTTAAREKSVEELLHAIRREALSAWFPVDDGVYRQAGKDPAEPILFAGSLEAPVCLFGRDLGREEVKLGQPLVGPAGRLARAGVCDHWEDQPPERPDRHLETALRHVFLANTVPYKPPGNKAYSHAVKERFRPFIAELLHVHWTGDRVITLGSEAFHWFAPYAQEDPETFWAREDRYEADLCCLLPVEAVGGTARKVVTVSPLPHPSPLNVRWFKKFPELLAKRLAAIRCECGPAR